MIRRIALAGANDRSRTRWDRERHDDDISGQRRHVVGRGADTVQRRRAVGLQRRAGVRHPDLQWRHPIHHRRRRRARQRGLCRRLAIRVRSRRLPHRAVRRRRDGSQRRHRDLGQRGRPRIPAQRAGRRRRHQRRGRCRRLGIRVCGPRLLHLHGRRHRDRGRRRHRVRRFGRRRRPALRQRRRQRDQRDDRRLRDPEQLARAVRRFRPRSTTPAR